MPSAENCHNGFLENRIKILKTLKPLNLTLGFWVIFAFFRFVSCKLECFENI